MTSSQSPLLPDATRTLARFAAETPPDAIPADVVERIKLSFLDGLGVSLRGTTFPWTRMVRDFVQQEGGDAVASLWGTGARTSLGNAVLFNGTAGHAFEMDDIHKESIIHPNSLAAPVALALAEADPSLSGREIAIALTLGYEVGLRIGNAATTALFLNGFHPQGTSGAFVAAATAGRLLRLDAEKMQHALGIAGSLGAGLMAAQEGAMVKRLHAGRAAQSGLTAALLARRGFTGISDVVEASYGGFLSSLARTPNVARLLEGLGTDWEAGKVGFKMYPNVTSIHAALDGLRAILVEEKVNAGQIKEIRVGCGHMTFVHTAWDYRPVGTTAAQMNMYYGLSVMAQRRNVGAADYADETIADPKILAFIPRIKVAEDPEIEAKGPALRHAARVAVITADGQHLSRDVWHRRGSPENPVSRAEVEEKFAANVDGLLATEPAARLQSLVARLDTLADVGEIAAIMASRAGT
ncbi:MAG TPA: MmgE/PrpD family protein [Xanthobacteraceae bacterium]|nr:MmgE/PrpD family protein [Xanthobacteraceae bacterium]